MKGAKFGVSSIVVIGLLAGSTVSVGAQESESPTEFSGRWVYSYTMEDSDDSGTWAYVAEQMSDPRLDGLIALSGNGSEFADGPAVWNSAFRIVNDLGSWQEVPGWLLNFGDETASTRTGLLVGEGAYEGLVVVADLAWDPSGVGSAFDVRGYILDADDLPSTVTIAGEGE